jgi:hypothetical protein
VRFGWLTVRKSSDSSSCVDFSNTTHRSIR